MLDVLRVSPQQFGRVPNDPWSGRVMVDNRIPLDRMSGIVRQQGVTIGSTPAPAARPITSINLRPVIMSAWQSKRDELRIKVLQYLSERDIGSGFRTSHNGLELAADGQLYAGSDGTGFTYKFVLPGNSLVTQIRTPTPLDSRTDPKFRVKFDLTITGDIDIQNNTLRARGSRVTSNVHRPTGRNVTGELVVAVNNLFDVLSGEEFVGQLDRQSRGTAWHAE